MSLQGSPPANFVIIRHDNGLLGYYWHLKKGSVTTKAVGQRVVVGEQLGFVGISGFSTGPHLHFELQNAGGTVIDPFTGQCNAGTTKWTHQSRPVDPGLVRIAAHSIPPPNFSNCDNPDPGYATRFVRGATIYAVAYLRDQTPATKATVAILRPDGSVAFSATTPPTSFLSYSYWWWGYTLNFFSDPAGEWRG